MWKQRGKKKASKLGEGEEDISTSDNLSISHGCLEMSHHVHISGLWLHVFHLLVLISTCHLGSWLPSRVLWSPGGAATSTLRCSPSQMPHSTVGSKTPRREVMWCVCCERVCACLWCKHIPSHWWGKSTNRAAALLFPLQEQSVANGCHANEPDRLLWHHSIR